MSFSALTEVSFVWGHFIASPSPVIYQQLTLPTTPPFLRLCPLCFHEAVLLFSDYSLFLWTLLLLSYSSNYFSSFPTSLVVLLPFSLFFFPIDSLDYKFKSHFYTMVHWLTLFISQTPLMWNAYVTGSFTKSSFLLIAVTCIRRQVSESGCYWDHLVSVLISEKWIICKLQYFNVSVIDCRKHTPHSSLEHVSESWQLTGKRLLC